MFIDYVPLMLINMAAGLFLLAIYIYQGIDGQKDKGWGAAFLVSGAVAFITGLHMTWNWPLPGSYNVAFGEMSVLLGGLFLGAGLCLVNNWSLIPLGVYAFFSGLASVVVGFRIINLGLTREPLVSGMGFILSGLSGMLICLGLYL